MEFFESNQGQFELLAIIALAMALGALIGYERELKDKPAGLRTHMLVAGAAALFVGLGDVLIEHFSETLQTASISSDPIRVMQAVLTGVSFLGAGTILRRTDESKVEGLTTAASILFAAAVGSTVALEQFIVAVGSTLLVLVTLRGLGILEHRLWHDGEYHE